MAGTNAATTSVPVRVAWPASMDTNGIARYEVSLQTDGGSWKLLAATSATAASKSLTAGHSYRFRVRSIDGVGNSTVVAGTAFKVTVREEGSALITYTGTWSRSASTAYHAGAARFSTRAGASATVLLVGRSVAWMASVGPMRGSARIYVDGIYAGSVSLYAATAANRRLVFARTWATPGTHRLEVRSLGTSGRPRIDVDAFVVVD